MKIFVILNGNDLYIRQYKTQEEALTFAQNYMDHSKPVIVKEVYNIKILN